MILVWGVPNDRPVAAVRAALERRNQPVFFLNQHDVLDTEMDLSVDGIVEGVLRSRSGEVELGAITAAYLRPYDSVRLPALADALPNVAARAAAFDNAMLCWSELTSARVVNRPSAMTSNQSKPHQLALIHAQGFQVPETLLTTDAAEVEAFWERHGEIIYKSMSGVRSIVSRLTPEHRVRFGGLAHSPVQFQQWIPGHDVRVHVAGEEVFACNVGSSAIDYRYPQSEEEAPRIAPCCLPGELAGRCLRLAASLGLDLAGIDLRRTPEGEWYCFEVNPSPAFTFYAEATGQPIDDAVARLLADAIGVSPGS
jgi:glutathione synthase/RimK-type ligase-like ATP-grasp enzyme